MTNEALGKDTLYRDPTPLGDTKNIETLIDGIRHKTKGADVREAIATALEVTYETAASEGNANMEVTKARGKHEDLATRLAILDGTLISADAMAKSTALNKVDKDGAGQVTYAMLAQDVRSKFTGDSVAVVGRDAVSTENVVNQSITEVKLQGTAINAQYFPSLNGGAIYDPDTGILDFNNRTANQTASIRFNGKWVVSEVGATIDLSGFTTTAAVVNILIDISNGAVSAQQAAVPVPANAAVIGRVRLWRAGGQSHTTSFEGPIAQHLTYKQKLQHDSNFQFCPSQDGIPWLDYKRNRINFNCVTDSAFINYNNRSYTLKKGAYCDLSTVTSSNGSIILDLQSGEVTAQNGYGVSMLGKFCIGHFRKTYDSQIIITGFPLASVADPVQVKEDSTIQIVAHRGFNAIAPEETEDAYLLATAFGFNHWECDLHFTSDNVPVLHHDETINAKGRMPDGATITNTVAIKDVTYSELLNYDFGLYKSNYFAGTKILKFEDFVSMARRHNVKSLHIEIKSQLTSEQRQVLYDIAKKHRMLDRCVWYSFHATELAGMAGIDENIQLGLLSYSYSDGEKSVLESLENGKRTVIAALSHTVSKDEAQKAIGDGYDLYIWTVNSSNALLKYKDIPVAAIMTDGHVNINAALRKI
ncbi:TPA: glycerophosphodiester phosphodiesterase [Streptococcus suis]